MSYTTWPLGHIPEHLQRPELKQLKEAGYEFNDPREVIDIFEKKVAAFAGSKYAVAVDSCSHGIFLSLKYLQYEDIVILPEHTYVSVPLQVEHSGAEYTFETRKWSGVYQLTPTRIFDGAGRWTEGMYVGNNALHVLSFQIKKHIPIGKGGMILTDDEYAYNWLKLASYDGRDLNKDYTVDVPTIKGWHYYMTPEDAARGILLMDQKPPVNEDSHDSTKYPSLKFKL